MFDYYYSFIKLLLYIFEFYMTINKLLEYKINKIIFLRFIKQS
jgi:hypothetical protein